MVDNTIVQSARQPHSALLILEDFDALRARLGACLVKTGYDVFSSATLRDALAIGREEAPRVIIVDNNLSSEGAAYAIKRLHTLLPRSYILLIGGPDSLDFRERLELEGASKVLSNGYSPCELTQIIESISNTVSV